MLNEQVEQTSQEGLRQLTYSQRNLATLIDHVHSSVRLLGADERLVSFLRTQAPVQRTELSTFWSRMLENQLIYTHVRLINEAGQELIRLNVNSKQSRFVEEGELQNKIERDYFKFAQQLEAGNSGAFGLDLEMENGALVLPYTPAIRVIMPVDSDGQRLGYIVANLNVAFLMNSLNYSLNSSQLPEVVNEQGYYLFSNSGNLTFGHLIKERREHNLRLKNPSLWQEMTDKIRGFVFDGDSLHVFITTDLHPKNLDNHTFFVLNYSLKDIQHSARDVIGTIKRDFILSLLLVFLVSIGIALVIARQRYHSLEAKLARAALQGMSPVVISDKHNRILKINAEFTRLTGYESDDVLGKKPSMLSSGEHDQEYYREMWEQLNRKGSWEGEIKNRTKSGSIITELMRIQAIKDRFNVAQYYIASYVEITERKQLEEQLRRLSERDELTQLWNRRKFNQELEYQSKLISRYAAKSSDCCIAIIDVDHFKQVNDQYGHQHGDKVLGIVADTLRVQCRSTDFISRVGGEEFAVIMPHTSVGNAEIVLNRLRIAIHYRNDNKVSISAGLSTLTGDPVQSYKQADDALYKAKSEGRNQVTIYSS
ncbi:diguanylate cyclase [Alginatibacterium sediminis]|uniref:Diguanylate cyclase n=1 Tax=Alginatibacterium sediminis TaxID=2164068 RepID=A0A420EGD4_9ALTE|nr:diguanylate cyclase [Alginatibacterium sediminis]RKF19737.1 diguanylate cyclase [Alginatibacterium sediminis]